MNKSADFLKIIPEEKKWLTEERKETIVVPNPMSFLARKSITLRTIIREGGCI